MGIIVKILLNALAVAITAYFLPQVELDSFWTAIIVAFALGVINTFIKPIISVLALPITMLTLGLASLVINGAFIMLVSELVEGFSVENFLWAVIFGVVLSIVSSILGAFKK